MTNIPYVKEYNDMGEVSNPIDRVYLNPYPNRWQRKSRPGRFIVCGKNFPLTLSPDGKLRYKRVLQIVGDKKIEHYIQ